MSASFNRAYIETNRPNGYITEPAAEKLSPTFTQTIDQMRAVSDSPDFHTVPAIVYLTESAWQPGTNKETGLDDSPSPILHTNELLKPGQDGFSLLLESAVDPEGVPDDYLIAERTLLWVKAQGKLCLAQTLVLPERERDYFGTFGQLTIDVQDHTLKANTFDDHGVSVSLSDSETASDRVAYAAQKGDYVTYDWRVGGHTLKYVHDGLSYTDHLQWMYPDEDGDYLAPDTPMPDEAYDADAYPRLSKTMAGNVLRMLQTAEPYHGPIAEQLFPALTFPER